MKPSAGGGGTACASCATRERRRGRHRRRRAARPQAAFGDGTLYVERLVERPRHVEIQVFADDHGSVVHLFERECSLQRRHQKVIEESPSPALTPALRAARWARPPSRPRAPPATATPARSSSCSTSAATQPRFYFLEMNTRLQVEHPGDRAGARRRSGARAAAGRGRASRCRGAGDQLPQRGHAIECRVYAEDPAHGFLPQAGPLLLYREPRGPGIRVDSGVGEGGDVSVHYDPLLAKLIVHAPRRARRRSRAPRARAARVPDPRHPDQHAVPARAAAASRRPRRTARHRLPRSRDRRDSWRSPRPRATAAASQPSRRQLLWRRRARSVAGRGADRRRPVDDARRVADIDDGPRSAGRGSDTVDRRRQVAGGRRQPAIGCRTRGARRRHRTSVARVGTADAFAGSFTTGASIVVEDRASRRGSRGARPRADTLTRADAGHRPPVLVKRGRRRSRQATR